MDNIKLSIITICYNEVERIEKTITSVLNQTFTGYQYIVIDGASSDGTVDIIKKYEDRIDVFVSEPDSGIYNAMNKGLKYAEGEYVLFLNGGDYLFEIDVLKIVFEHNIKADVIYGFLIIIEDNEQQKSIWKPPEKVNKLSLFIHTLPHQATFTKKILLLKTQGFSENFRIGSDYDFFLKAFFTFSAKFQSIPIIISIFNKNGISANSIELAREERSAIRSEYFSRLTIARYILYNYVRQLFKNLVNIFGSYIFAM
jgi:glycosyltransferase involved in cell wall biosynthesis